MKIKFFETVKIINDIVPVFVNRNYSRKTMDFYNLKKNEIHITYNEKKKIQSIESLIHEFTHFLTIRCLPKSKEHAKIDNTTGLPYYEIYEAIAEMVTVEVSSKMNFRYTYEGHYMEIIGVEKYQKIYNDHKDLINDTISLIYEIIK